MNNELDIDHLKKSWKEQEISSNNYSRAELIQMLNKKSGNIVKYIVIISIVEFLILILSLFFISPNPSSLETMSPQAQETYLQYYQTGRILVYINIFISFGFVFFFYRSYKKINVTNSTKELIHNILLVRKNVNWFIFINITLGLAALFFTGFHDFLSGLDKNNPPLISSNTQNSKEAYTLLSSSEYLFWFLTISVISIAVVLLYYYFIYGTLLRKLKKNLSELQKYDG